MLEDRANFDEVIPLKQYSTVLLKRVLEFCKLSKFDSLEYVKKPILTTDLAEIYQVEWEREFFQSLSNTEVFELLNTANFLDIPKLVDSCCAFIARIFKKSTDDELADKFGMDLSMTAKEEEALKKEFEFVLDIDKNRYQNLRTVENGFDELKI